MNRALKLVRKEVGLLCEGKAFLAEGKASTGAQRLEMFGQPEKEQETSTVTEASSRLGLALDKVGEPPENCTRLGLRSHC